MPSIIASPAPQPARCAARFLSGLLVALLSVSAAATAQDAQQLDAESTSAHPAPALYRVIVLHPGTLLTSLPRINSNDQAAFGLETAEGQRGFFYDGTRVRDIGTLGGPITWVQGLNDAGQIVGRSYLTSENHRAFVWDADGGMIDLGALPGHGESDGAAINNHGVVTGTSWANGPVPPHAFRWSVGDGMEDLGAFGTGFEGISFGDAINDAGVIGGASDQPGGRRHAFVWRRETGMVDIHTLAEGDSSAGVVGAGGEVAGNYVSLAGETALIRAFLWTAATGMRDLGTAGGSESIVTAMNDHGRIAGLINFPDEGQHAMSWTRAGGMVDLGTLGGAASIAFDVNNKGQVVGRSRDASGQDRGFLWTAQDGMIDLNKRLRNAPAGLVVGSALAISDNGAIVAEASAGMVLLKPCCADRPRGEPAQAPAPAPAR
ncbi:hypothetical protein NHH73_11575 [Oxalobacteraceae bacterium OTU3CINTB1]|nr:hypothetical protein NHH73_11575 [Oxalobacteraceae bacterium OTU3CINTB1]